MSLGPFGRGARSGLLPTLLALALVACDGGTGGVRERSAARAIAARAWERLDLAATPPARASRLALGPASGSQPAAGSLAGGGPGSGPALARGVAVPLGPEETRDLTRIALAQRARQAPLPAGEITALAQRAGTRLAWTIALGEDPYFSFVPLRNATFDAPLEMRVAAQAAGEGARLLHRAVAPPASDAAPATVHLDLARFAGRSIELVLEVGSGGESQALWGSPTVWSRRPLPVRVPERPWSVLLIGADTLRADALGAYGRSPSVTPALDALAAESDLFLHAYTSFHITNPSFASILTGLYGKDHGVYDLSTRLPARTVTLAEAFAAAGYDTHGIVSVEHLGDRHSGLGQGFAGVQVAATEYAGELATDRAMDWIAGRERPFFLWLHLFDPHTPHAAPRPFAQGQRPARRSGLAPPAAWTAFREPGLRRYLEPQIWHRELGADPALYLGEVAYLDRQIDRLLDFLDSRGLLERTVVAFVADHGENIGEHGIYLRHAGLWETTAHVPLLLRWPQAPQRGRRLPGLVQTLDLFPTLLAAAGVPVPKQDGRDLRRVAADGRGSRRAVFGEMAGGIGAMVRTERWKYMTCKGNELLPRGPLLYDLESDPAEERNLAGTGNPVEDELAGLLERFLRDRRGDADAAERLTLSEEEEARLRALGY